VATTPTGGNHETITRFYMMVICRYVAKEAEAAGSDWAAPVHHLLERYGWVEPDLGPIA
jgi:hypothetical protein